VLPVELSEAVRDLQTLIGILVDQGVARPDAIGTTGISYGGGMSTMLAFLKDRVRLPDGSLVPWTSPNGTPIHIAAAWPRWQWSNGEGIFLRNGRSDAWSRTPTGVPTAAYAGGIFLVAFSGFTAPEGGPIDTDVHRWKTELDRIRYVRRSVSYVIAPKGQVTIGLRHWYARQKSTDDPRQVLDAAVAAGSLTAADAVAVWQKYVSRQVLFAEVLLSLGHLDSAASDLGGAGSDRLLPLRADVRSYEEVEKALAATVQWLGGIDILVNNAGVGVFRSVAETTFAEWHRIIDPNRPAVF
jgi:hypothetical protein